MVKKFSSEIDIVLALLVGETGETKKILKKKRLNPVIFPFFQRQMLFS